MEKFRFIWIWFTVLLFLRSIGSESGVRIKYNEQRITSSTLKWIAHSSAPIPEDAVVGSVEYVLTDGVSENDLLNFTDRSHIKERKIYICSAVVNGNRVPGALILKPNNKTVCIVHSVSKVFHQDKYEILQNVDKAARLLWIDWVPDTAVPNGAVSTERDFVAHSPSSRFKVLNNNVAIGMSYLVGKIDPSLGIFGKMSVVNEDGQVNMNVHGGQVLVEVEPVLYEISVTKLTANRKRVLSRNQTILGEITLQNNDPIEMKADAIITYSWKYISSWGPGRAMLKGLQTTVYLLDSTVENITWALPFEAEKNGLEKVEAILPSGTAVHVQLVAEYLEEEVPYMGILLSVFGDSTMMNRSVYGNWKYATLIGVRPIYGPLYFISNNTLVPTTTTTTTEPPITTTSSTTTMTNEIIRTTINEMPKTEERRTTTSTKEEEHSMQNDQSGAMQLNKKNESDKTGSGQSICDFHSSLLTVSLLLITLMYSYVVHTIT